MATNCVIGVYHGDKVKSVYCHSDGYLSFAGALLQARYDSAMANELVANGDVSELGYTIGTKHIFYERENFVNVPGVRCHVLEHCTFYKRDRDDEGCEFNVFHSDKEMFEYYSCDHYYIMKEGVWYYSNGYHGWMTLATALATATGE
jgi:hypothetical protein